MESSPSYSNVDETNEESINESKLSLDLLKMQNEELAKQLNEHKIQLNLYKNEIDYLRKALYHNELQHKEIMEHIGNIYTIAKDELSTLLNLSNLSINLTDVTRNAMSFAVRDSHITLPLKGEKNEVVILRRSFKNLSNKFKKTTEHIENINDITIATLPMLNHLTENSTKLIDLTRTVENFSLKNSAINFLSNSTLNESEMNYNESKSNGTSNRINELSVINEEIDTIRSETPTIKDQLMTISRLSTKINQSLRLSKELSKNSNNISSGEGCSYSKSPKSPSSVSSSPLSDNSSRNKSILKYFKREVSYRDNKKSVTFSVINNSTIRKDNNDTQQQNNTTFNNSINDLDSVHVPPVSSTPRESSKTFVTKRDRQPYVRLELLEADIIKTEKPSVTTRRPKRKRSKRETNILKQELPDSSQADNSSQNQSRRPSRAAKPKKPMTEPSLNKKMRRNK